MQFSILHGQVFTGLIQSNYNGINALSFNPAASVNTRTYAEISPVSAGFALDNTFLFFHPETFRWTALLKRKPEYPVPKNSDKGLDYRNSSTNVYGHLVASLNGPSALLAGHRHSVAITTGIKSVASTTNLPYDLALLMYEGLDYQPLHEKRIVASNVKSGELAWSEIALNYATVLHENRMGRLSAGANFRKLFGISGSCIHINRLDLMVINRYTVSFQNVNAYAGFSLPVNYDNNDFILWNDFFRGSGSAADIGIMYRRNRNVSYLRSWGKTCEVPFEEYVYKVGLSVINLGQVKFVKNALEHRISDASVIWQSIDTVEYTNINNLIGQINEVFFHDPQYSLTNNNAVALNLPAAINFFGEIQYYPRWYFSVLTQCPIPSSNIPVNLPSSLIMSLRYESDDYEFSLPVLLYRMNKPYIGLYLRYKYLSIGCHRPEKFLKLNEIDGADFYVSFNIFLQKGKCLNLRPQRGCSPFGF